jgi:IclR family acetate operon transcriptional repressor
LAEPLVSVTDSTVINRQDLLAELRSIRERGWASSSGERQSGAASIAAPVLNHAGAPVAALSVSGPKDRFDTNNEKYVKFLLESTNRLSRKMGYQG